MNEFLQRKAYEYLDSVQDLENITLKDVVKKLIEEDINLSHDYFKNELNKEQLKQIIVNYHKSILKPITFEHDIDGNIIYKQGKFSKQERDLIVQAVDDYIKEHDMNISDLCSHLRDDDKRHRKIIKILREIIPNRDKKSLWHFMSRMTGKTAVAAQNEQEYHGTFTEEEKIRLNELIRIHGHKFSKIASLMDKLPDDCRQMFIRMKGRIKSGAFTQEEDLAIINAVRKATNSFVATTTNSTTTTTNIPHISQLPVKYLPWTAIALELNNERYPLDYNRRWSTIVKSSRIKEQTSNILPNATMISQPIDNNNNGKHVKNDRKIVLIKRIKLLEILLENDYTDERDVLWAEMDRNFDDYVRCLNVWKDMQKDIKGSLLIGFEDKIDQLLYLYKQQLSDLSGDINNINNSINNNNNNNNNCNHSIYNNDIIATSTSTISSNSVIISTKHSNRNNNDIDENISNNHHISSLHNSCNIIDNGEEISKKKIKHKKNKHKHVEPDFEDNQIVTHLTIKNSHDSNRHYEYDSILLTKRKYNDINNHDNGTTTTTTNNNNTNNNNNNTYTNNNNDNDYYNSEVKSDNKKKKDKKHKSHELNINKLTYNSINNNDISNSNHDYNNITNNSLISMNDIIVDDHNKEKKKHKKKKIKKEIL